MTSTLNVIFTLSRVSNLPTVWTNCMAAWTINKSIEKVVGQTPEWHHPYSFDWGIFGWLLLGASFIYAGGCVLNDAYDQKFDQEYNPERPIPSGEIKASTVWMVGGAFVLIGGLLLSGFASCSMPLVGCLIGSVILYDWLHKKWVGSVWIMGSCRTFLWCVAASAGGLEISNPIWVCSLCVGAYVVGISLFARNESKKTKNGFSNQLPVLLLFSPCLLTLALLILWNHLDPTRVFLLNCVGLYLGWIVIRAILIMRNSAVQGAIGKGVSILLPGICAVDAIAVCFFIPSLIAPCYLAQFFAQTLQKKFAAT